jgi:hypothetical protein
MVICMPTNINNDDTKRLNIKLDQGTFGKLEKIKALHGDGSYTQAIKRAIAMLEFLDEKKEDGLELFLGKEGDGKVMQMIVAP